jgi:hypothetical protein
VGGLAPLSATTDATIFSRRDPYGSFIRELLPPSRFHMRSTVMDVGAAGVAAIAVQMMFEFMRAESMLVPPIATVAGKPAETE